MQVVIGKPEELARIIVNTGGGWSYDKALEQCRCSRGSTWDLLEIGLDPLITIDETLGDNAILATLPHEASHAADDVAKYIGLSDSSGEFRAHIISAVMRKCVPFLIKRAKK